MRNAIDEGFWYFLKYAIDANRFSPAVDPLRGDPRFEAMHADRSEFDGYTRMTAGNKSR